MPKCNLFKDITKETGTFFTFSQYSEDLTKHFTNPNTHKVVPSKYICLDLPDLDTVSGVSANISFPSILQNYFENRCTFLRYTAGEDSNYNYKPSDSLEVFFSTLIKSGHISVVDANAGTGENAKFIDANNIIKYIGDINLYSYNENDGMGYNEIYCYVPADAKEIDKLEFSDNVGTNASLLEYTSNIIMGWEDGMLRYESNLPYTAQFDDTTGGINSYKYHSGYIPKFEDTSYTGNDKFKFNAILVLYDVYDGDTIVEGYQNIPMGLYITGVFNSIEGKDVLQNTITKYTVNNDIYGQGTAYGLRICSRFLAMPNGSELTISTVAAEQDMGISTYAQAVSTMVESIEKMNSILSTQTTHTNNIDEHLGLFMSNRTNVPYVREIDGIKYWFVNGRNTKVRVNMSDDLNIDHTVVENSNNLITSGAVYNSVKDKLNKPNISTPNELVKFSETGTLTPSGVKISVDPLSVQEGEVLIYSGGVFIPTNKTLNTIIADAIALAITNSIGAAIDNKINEHFPTDFGELVEGDTIVYDATLEKWKNVPAVPPVTP